MSKNWLTDYTNYFNTICVSDDASSGITSFSDSFSNCNSFSSISFPLIRRVQATTLGGGGWIKSEKQKLKEDRINKINKIKGKKFDTILPNDKFIDGLISVIPMSMPSPTLFYFDYCYSYTGNTLQDCKCKALEDIKLTKRYIGYTISLQYNNKSTEYWFQNGVEDNDLVCKSKK